MKRLLAVAFSSIVGLTAFGQWIDITPGPNLEGWAGRTDLWSVKDGILIGTTYGHEPLTDNTFLVWKGGRVRDFELELEFKLIPHNQSGWANSGIQYRSRLVDSRRWIVSGYQADIDASGVYTGILYEERGRGILATQGQKVKISATGSLTVEGQVESVEKVQAQIKRGEWNRYRIIAEGARLIHEVNGVRVVDVVDLDRQHAASSGLFAFQLHRGEPMEVQFRNIRLRPIDPVYRIILIAGPGSHGEGAHEFEAGLSLLKSCLDSLPGIQSVLVKDWPSSLAELLDADAIVIYCDGGEGHLLLQGDRLAQLDKATRSGSGVGLMHYALDVPEGPAREALLRWIGGYYETWWSVNPSWEADFGSLPKHPVTNGVSPFRVFDEWYYHMRFVSGMRGITPILSALPPASTLSGPDGPHSNNPYVRQEVLQEKKPQVVMWVYERDDGGRGFGFTGGHYHKNWAVDQFRRVVLNAIVWIARAPVPDNGVSCLIRPDKTAR